MIGFILGLISGGSIVLILLAMVSINRYVEIIRCKDCLRSDDSIKGVNRIYCRKNMNWVDKEGFCSDAERRNR